MQAGHSVLQTGPPWRVSLLLQICEEFSHAAGSFIDILLCHRVGDADVLRRAKGLTGNGDDVGLVEQAGRQLGCCT